MRVLAALSLAALAPCFLAPAPLAPLTRLRTGEKSGHERRTACGLWAWRGVGRHFGWTSASSLGFGHGGLCRKCGIAGGFGALMEMRDL